MRIVESKSNHETEIPDFRPVIGCILPIVRDRCRNTAVDTRVWWRLPNSIRGPGQQACPQYLPIQCQTATRPTADIGRFNVAITWPPPHNTGCRIN